MNFENYRTLRCMYDESHKQQATLGHSSLLATVVTMSQFATQEVKIALCNVYFNVVGCDKMLKCRIGHQELSCDFFFLFVIVVDVQIIFFLRNIYLFIYF